MGNANTAAEQHAMTSLSEAILGLRSPEELDASRTIHGRLRELARCTGGCIAFLVGEAGMGKSFAVRALAGALEEDGFAYKEISLGGKTSSQATKSLANQARTVPLRKRSAEGEPLLLVDDFPPTEECDLSRQAASLRRIAKAGIKLMVCMRPDAEQLVEEMDDVVELRTSDLLVRQELLEDSPQAAALTAGIPSLFFALQRDLREGRDPKRPDSAYFSALRSIVGNYLRPQQADEDIELRLAMMLLGSGTADELAAVVGKLDAETLAWQRDEAPLFRIDHALTGFCTAGLTEEGVVPAIINTLGDAVDEGMARRVSCDVASVLACRGEYRRSVQVARLCGNRELARLVASWGIEYLLVGEVSVVRTALEGARSLDLPLEGGLACAAAALRLFELPASKLDGNMLGRVSASYAGVSDATARELSRNMRHLELVQACRDLDRGLPPGRVALINEDDDELSQALVAHLEARSNLLQGHISEAYRQLVNNPHRLAGNSLPSALLSDDFEIASVLLGEEPDEIEIRAFEQARTFLTGLGIRRLSSYRPILEKLVCVLAGRSDDMDGVEVAISCAEAVGDQAIAACLLLGAAVCDMRAGQHARAHVRALQSSDLARWVDDSLYRSATLVDAVIHLFLGDDKPLSALLEEDSDSTTAQLTRMLLRSTGRNDLLVGLPTLDPRPDHDLLWIVNILSNDIGDRSVSFRENLPEIWTWTSRRAVRKADAFGRLWENGTAKPVAPREPATYEPQLRLVENPPIEVRLLGGLEVRIKGRPLPERGLGRRRSSALIVSLASCESHKMTRSEIVETVWPECSYAEGLQRLYEATSRTRAALGVRELGIDLFQANRGEGVLSLNPACVFVDVDDFVRRARRALAAREDEQVLDYALLALNMYRGDLFVSTFDAHGAQSARRQELRDLYGDVSLAAVRSALHEGKTTTASRLAHRAYEICEIREDVTLAYIEALKMAGRLEEAREVYREFAKSLLERTGMLPSTSMRRAVEGFFPQTGTGRRGGETDEDGYIAIAR